MALYKDEHGELHAVDPACIHIFWKACGCFSIFSR